MVDVHLRELRSFLAVADALHFTRAAEALHVSQPVLSKQIRTLEGQVRARLFERDRRTVRLTTAGAALVPHAQRVVAAWEDGRRELSRAAAGTLVVGMQTSPGRGLLPEVRARLADTCPEAELSLRQVNWQDPTAGLADRSSDAAFLWLPLDPPDAYRWVVIARERRFVALAAGHHLAGRPQVKMADLLDEPFLALPATSPAMRDDWLAVEHRGGQAASVVAEIRDTEETYEAIATGIGVCLLAEGNVPIFDRGDVVMLPVTDLPPAEYVLAWNRDEPSPLRETFVHICAAVAAQPERAVTSGASRRSTV